MKNDIGNARQFFEYFVKIAGQLELYKILFGELPTDKDSANRLVKMQQSYDDLKPLREDIEKIIRKRK